MTDGYYNHYLATFIREQTANALLRKLRDTTEVRQRGDAKNLFSAPEDLRVLLLCVKEDSEDTSGYTPGVLAWDTTRTVEEHYEAFPFETLHPVSPWIFYLEARRLFPRCNR